MGETETPEQARARELDEAATALGSAFVALRRAMPGGEWPACAEAALEAYRDASRRLRGIVGDVRRACSAGPELAGEDAEEVRLWAREHGW